MKINDILKNENAYEILNIKNFSNIMEIKRSFRKLSLKYHPDKNNNNSNMFHKINEIYLYLSNDNNKKVYDNYLKSKLEKEENSKEEIKNNKLIFENKNILLNDIEYELIIEMEESYNGCVKPINIKREIIINCDYNVEKKYEDEIIYVECFQGIDDGEIIEVKQKGNKIIYNEKIELSDIKVKIKLKKHKIFERRGIDLYYTKNISLLESLIGFNFNIHHLNNNIYNINNDNKIIKPNENKVIKGLGIKRKDYVGSLIINFNIIFPDYLYNEQKIYLKKVFEYSNKENNNNIQKLD